MDSSRIALSVEKVPFLIQKRFKSALEEAGYNSGSIVIRESRPATRVPIGPVLKEMYVTGYASHYELGPRLLASYYITDDDYDMTSNGKRGKSNLYANVQKTVSVSVAWDGDCSGLLREVAKLNSDNFPPDFCTKFGELFVDLAKAAADVGLFHGDLKPQNMLYCNENVYRNENAHSSFKIPFERPH